MIAVLLLALTAVMPVCAQYNSEIKGDMYSPVYMLVSLDDSTVIFNKGENKKCPPATFVKIVTAITVLENCKDLDMMITANDEALNIVGYEYGMVTSELTAGESMSVRNLLYCCMLQSANDASNVLAWHFGSGKVSNFVKKMNDLVKSLGCENTVLKNATGLDADGQYTTAADMVKIISYGLSLPVFKEIFNASSIDIPKTNKHSERTYYTGNSMVFSTNGEYYYEYVTGGKAGATDKAGRVIAATATKDGYTYLAIVMKGERKALTSAGEEKNLAVLDAQTMFRWAYANIRLKTVAKPSQIITVVNVKSGKDADHVGLVPADEVTALVPANADYSSVLIEPIEGSVKDNVTAPVYKGDVLGQAKIIYSGKEIARVDLAAAETVKRSGARFVGNIFVSVFSSSVFKAVAGIVVILVAVFIVITLAGYYKERKQKG
ncbi:MAG: serine hydrolase [Clostridia bacterium]|nr:serine hydrolase [Clostridia bacterium]